MNGSNRRLIRRQAVLSVLCALLVIAGTAAAHRRGLLNWADNYLYDLHFKWRGPGEASGDVILALMDQESARTLGRHKSSWSRRDMAKALSNLCDAGAEIVGLDLIFISPDPDPGADQALAEAMDRCGNVVLARGTATHGGGMTSLERFQAASIGDGFIDFLTDGDEVLRRIRYLAAIPVSGGVELIPSFSVELVRTYRNLSFAFDFSDPAHLIMGAEGEDRLRLPQPDLLVNFRGDYTIFPRISFADAVLGRFDPETVRGKLAIIGSSLATEKDVFTTPYTRFQDPAEAYGEQFGAAVSDVVSAKELGVACHAHAAETLLSGTWIERLSDGRALWLIAAAGLAGLVFYLPQIGIAWTALILAGSLGLIVGAAHLLFLEARLWVAIAPLLLVLILQYVAGTAIQKVFDRKRAALVTHLFGRYVSAGVVRELIQGNIDVSMEGRRRELTLFFSDLRGFTTLSEGLGPRDTGRLLNLYFSRMIPVIFKHGGTLDKLMGDAVMAFFGAPIPVEDHPAKGAEAALETLDMLDRLRRENADVPGIEGLGVGIGLNTGVVTVGNLGSDDFMDYTVIGDAVNLASRLEGINKIYGTQIIVSGFTAEKLDDRFLLRELDRVKVKGKGEAVTLFELAGYRNAATPKTLERIEMFEAGLAAYRGGEWDAAETRFKEVLRIVEDPAARLFLQRIEAFRAAPPPDGWGGVTVFDHK